ncbi:GNAT family N-acetyltransferase [Bacillus atrophaeus]|uniref:GNAT family N-acetyltransferase n=1 Tax=Bacillus atrophaeus TaxID=1452 RepID=UPI002280563E|nr:GNAT family N-acetyltransferase [Bacillus atrophaeus]MCY8809670.1 GNAT family N-acetyltransferase [Bacillus atrophaeus]
MITIQKNIRFYDGRKYEKLLIRQYTHRDVAGLLSLQKECFPSPFPQELLWSKEQLHSHIETFQEGALCALVNDVIIGSMTALIVQFDPGHPDHTWAEITDHGYIRNHNKEGNTLYVVDISVSPSYRKVGIGKWLMQTMYELTVSKQLERLLGGARIPRYHKYSHELTAEQYVEAVLEGEKNDPVLSFLLHCGREPVGVVRNYLEDEESLHYGVLMEWKNPFYQKTGCVSPF